MLKFHPLKVLAVEADAEDAVALTLEVPEALRGSFRGVSGQHVVVRAMLDGAEVRRTYSLVNAPAEPVLRIVPRVHEHGQLSGYLGRAVRPGECLEVLPPNGSFSVRTEPAGGTYVAFAAGCGITPVLAVVRELLERGAAAVLLFYGNTGTARTMCLEELQGLKDRFLERLALHFVMSREPQEVELYNGRLDGARVRAFARWLFEPRAVREYFVCGPGDMIEAVSEALRGLGAAAPIHAEHFSLATTAAGAQPAPVASPAAATDAAEVTILMDGRRRRFSMPLGTESVLDGAARGRHRAALLLPRRGVLDLPHQGRAR